MYDEGDANEGDVNVLIISAAAVVADFVSIMLWILVS